MSFDKKRELQTYLRDCIITLSNMSEDIATIEIHDNDKISRKVKLDIARFEANQLATLKEKVKEVRTQINNKPKKPKS